ncbi:uncharacterized protein FIBRA_02635 [Fibroporia radiculosa]|uniref:FAD-binding domain-containing protein n=1 Tax=Fibroporia radiculosa TaxID=599839 RepID=J4H1Y8_9APHY|nr:uncharacterized protein FIBRA_02635 [Fibroporia radiculosa]CCM00599.1 predicted protein [Fibroporia radiculosa]
MSQKFTVAICGGGIGGLACAVALARYGDIQVDIYEAASQFAEIGAGIGMWPRTWKIMQKLGLERELAQVAIVPPDLTSRTSPFPSLASSLPVTDLACPPEVAFHFRKGDQPVGEDFYSMSTPGGLITFRRADFQAVLLRHIPPSCRTYTNKRLVSYSQSHTRRASLGAPPPPITLRFQDGTTATCSVLIGADGIKSATRAALVRELAETRVAEGRLREADELRRMAAPRWSGTCAYRAIIPADVLRARLPGHRVLHQPMMYFGKDTQITAYTIARGSIVNVAAFHADYSREDTTFDRPSVEDVLPEQVLHDFRDWEPEVQALFQSIPKSSRWAVHTVAPLPSFVSGRVAVLGDAAHGMMPYQGSGAGQAVEDGYILAVLLGHKNTTAGTLARALQVYDAIRRPFAQGAAARSHLGGLLYTFNAPGFTPSELNAGGAPKLVELAERVRQNFKWVWETSLDVDVERAVKMLEGGAGPTTRGRSPMDRWRGAAPVRV